jgi:flagellar assembly factor FliW
MKKRTKKPKKKQNIRLRCMDRPIIIIDKHEGKQMIIDMEGYKVFAKKQRGIKIDDTLKLIMKKYGCECK